MKNFKLKHITLLIYGSYILLITVNCNRISQGEQRRKFEFLYRLSNYAALTKELSAAIYHYKDISIYEEKFKNVRNDISKTDTLKNWNMSLLLKNEFIDIMDNNIKGIEELKKKVLKPDDIIKNEYEVIMMNERILVFTDKLNGIISDVGKE